jgi:hypothetical protein
MLLITGKWASVITAAVLVSTTLSAQYASEDVRLIATTPSDSAYLGRSVSVAGDLLVVGAPGDLSQGTVYVWRRTHGYWNFETTLNGSDESSQANFGIVSASGDTIAVGASGQSTNGTMGGAVYIFTWNGAAWSEQAKLTASDLMQGADFGSSVALSGDTLVVGSYWADGVVAGTGAAYVFTRSGTTWTEQTKLVAFDGAYQDNFGASVALSGNTVIVGAPRDTLVTSIEGSAYVFVGSGSSWSFQQKLTASDASSDDDFGASVSIDGDRLAVGADTAGPSPSDESGAAYVFDRSGAAWSESARVNALFRGPFDRFGSGVSLQGDSLVVGAPHESAAYVFARNGSTWYQRERLQPLATGDGFAGAAYTYRFNSDFDAFCFGDGSGTACPCGNSSPLGQGKACRHGGGQAPRLRVGGIPSVASDSVVLYAYDLLPTNAIYFQGSNQVNLGLGLVYGDGLRCAGAPIVRLVTIHTPGNGASNYPDATHTTPISVRGMVVPGQVKTYQVIYRDPSSACTPATFNLTNGVQVVWGP